MTDTAYTAATEDLAGHMSQTWERVISQVVGEQLVDYKYLEVRVVKLKVVARITTEDEQTFQSSYSMISGWASRHDPHPELNYVPPTVEALEGQIEIVDAWFKRVKKYQS